MLVQEKSNIRIPVRMCIYIYGVVRKGLCVMTLEIGWYIYVVQGLMVLVSKERDYRKAKFWNYSTTVVQKEFFFPSSCYVPNIFLNDLILKMI